ncbi:MAG TPA: L-threonylcarbamoyladenylate synthase [Gaiellaceae bacterium]|jgi:L-threonylcarbamoyladenylate synthase|nr:L-threonylcarbamoyladenylate synthase [Gaiellaceae bacterium]
MDARIVDDAFEGLQEGRAVVIPTDTVYGLCAAPDRPEPVHAMYRLKGREEGQPTAVIASSVDRLLELVPELRGQPEVAVRALLPGPFTLVLPNPAQRFRWLTGMRPQTLGVRVPELQRGARALLERVGILAATSANRAGEPDPRRVEEVPEEIRSACAAVIDGGELPGVPSTVVELTGPEPLVLREGAVPAAETLDRLRHAVS